MSTPPQDGSFESQFEQATLELAIAQNALTDAADFVRTQAPPPQVAGIDHAADDPHVILRFGQLRARLHAAEELLARATRLASAGNLPLGPVARPSGAGTATSPAATGQAGVRTQGSNAAAPPAFDAGGARVAIPSAPAFEGSRSASSASDVDGTDAAVLIALIEARAFTSDLVAEIAGQLVAWGGPLRTGQQRRDARGQLSYTANHLNYHYAGNYYLTGVAPVPHTPEPRS
jgi:alkylation response protein AidB-like acyl-CoA dehydrogenase